MKIQYVIILCWIMLALGAVIGISTHHPLNFFEYRYMPEKIKECESQGYQFKMQGNTATCEEVKNIWTIKVNEETLDLTK